jgi:hypothetical protein
MALTCFPVLQVVQGQTRNEEKYPPATESFFDSKIKPTLKGTCLPCHGGKKTRGGLRLDSRASLLRGGNHGPALVPGDPAKSLLIQTLRYAHEEIKMPPVKQLPVAVADDFAAWVKNGAIWPQSSTLKSVTSQNHWAFQPIKKVEPPVDPSGWSANPIDRFVHARLIAEGLQPARPADKRTLIRRITFDLIGLPPTPEEVAAFVADDSPDTYVKVVDRLLASPLYGERWGRHWLDVVRYSDTAGFETDQRYTTAWRYRDYVIQSLNRDKSYDRFLHEQVAGDELWPNDRDALLATGLYCVGPAEAESAMTGNQLEYEWLTDTVDTTGAAFLGLTLGCSRCHDHKYDPITQRDYFALQAVFAASDRPYPEKMRVLRIKGLNGLLSDAPVPKELLDDPRCTLDAEEKVGSTLHHRKEPMTVHRLQRGELSKPREIVEPAVPAWLFDTKQDTTCRGQESKQRRAILARWLTARENPLTTRVLVNRVWGWHFGQALVRTPNDFGSQGEPPTHPELLDWLANQFDEQGWSLKRLHRLILLSNTYRMQSIAEGKGLRIDPDNRLLWHYPRHRLEGEAVRDAMLACSGDLNLKQFGTAVVPPLTSQELTGLFDSKEKWPVTEDVAEHSRRSIYLHVRRTFHYPLLAAFDLPEVMTSCPQRMRTVVPTQALTLLNSPVTREQAHHFARRVARECDDNPEKIVARAWTLAFGRPISDEESKHSQAFLLKKIESLKKNDAKLTPLEAALSDLCLALFNSNEFIFIE